MPVKYFLVENSTNLIWKVSDTTFGNATGSGFHEYSSSLFYSPATPAGYLRCEMGNFVGFTGSVDVSGINNLEFLHTLYVNNIIDYKKYRARLQTYAYVSNFDSMSVDEQTICARAFAVAKSDRDKVLSYTEQVNYGRDFHFNSVEARKQRVDAAVALIYNDLEVDDAKQVVADVVEGISGSGESLVWKYAEFGIEGTLEGDVYGLFDYLDARTGSIFNGIGLRDKNYTLTEPSRSIDNTADELMDIFKNGNYTVL